MKSKKWIVWCLVFLLAVADLASAQMRNALQRPRQAAVPMLKDGSISAYIAFTRPKKTHGLALAAAEGTSPQEDVYRGFLGVMPAEDTEDKSLYFKTAADRITSSTGTFYVSIQYFDQGQGAVSLEFYQQAGEGDQEEPVLQSDRFFLGGSGFWEEHTFSLPNAILDARFPGESDFRIVCPNVPLRSIAISRVPLGAPKRAVGDTFQQPKIVPPTGFEFAIHLGKRASRDLWENDAVLDQKVRLYQSWGASLAVDTIDVTGDLNAPDQYDFARYEPRAEKLAERKMQWVPRFKIGDLSALPGFEVANLQRAMGIERPYVGPMISLWDPRLVQVYGNLFQSMRTQISSSYLSKVVLSFAGDWGPLFWSAEQSQSSAWPDQWFGDPLAKQSLIQYLQSKYVNATFLRAAWGVEVHQWEDVFQFIGPSSHPAIQIDVQTWYQNSLTDLATRIVDRARVALPRMQIEIEIGDRFQTGATDFAAFAKLAASRSCSLVMVTNMPIPAESYAWNLLAMQAREQHIPFGLRIDRTADSQTLLSAMFALAGDGGTLLQFHEDDLAPEHSWNIFARSVAAVHPAMPSRRIAMVFPRTSVQAFGIDRFETAVRALRERFGFDAIDENDLSRVSYSNYPFVIVPWGYLWTDAALQEFERIARSGSALIVRTRHPWQNLQGNLEINKRLFTGRIVNRNGELLLVPRSDDAQLSETDPFTPASSRDVVLGQPSDEAFLYGKWSSVETKGTAQRFGFDFDSFRWFREQASARLPMIPNRDYELEIEGYLPEGKTVNVFVNGKPVGDIEGSGHVTWKQPLTGSHRPRNKDVDILLRGQEWRTGQLLSATETYRVSMAVNRIALKPLRYDEKAQDQDSDLVDPEFRRELLRKTLLREVGRGVSLVVPEELANEWMFLELVTALSQNPKLLDPRFRFTEPPDGENNRVFVSPLSGLNLYLNLSSTPVEVGSKWAKRRIEVPPSVLFYSF